MLLGAALVWDAFSILVATRENMLPRTSLFTMELGRSPG